jgi:hypothetical protein
MKPYAQEPEDLRPFSKFTEPYYQHYVDEVEYNGAARDLGVAQDVSEVRIGFIGHWRIIRTQLSASACSMAHRWRSKKRMPRVGMAASRSG